MLQSSSGHARYLIEANLATVYTFYCLSLAASLVTQSSDSYHSFIRKLPCVLPMLKSSHSPPNLAVALHTCSVSGRSIHTHVQCSHTRVGLSHARHNQVCTTVSIQRSTACHLPTNSSTMCSLVPMMDDQAPWARLCIWCLCAQKLIAIGAQATYDGYRFPRAVLRLIF